MNDLSNMNVSTSLAIGISECYGKTYKPEPNAIYIYPNPSHNYINFEIPSGMAVDEVSCFDMSGKKTPVLFQPSEIINRIAFNLPSGQYDPETNPSVN